MNFFLGQFYLLQKSVNPHCFYINSMLGSVDSRYCVLHFFFPLQGCYYLSGEVRLYVRKDIEALSPLPLSCMTLGRFLSLCFPVCKVESITTYLICQVVRTKCNSIYKLYTIARYYYFELNSNGHYEMV